MLIHRIENFNGIFYSLTQKLQWRKREYILIMIFTSWFLVINFFLCLNPLPLFKLHKVKSYICHREGCKCRRLCYGVKMTERVHSCFWSHEIVDDQIWSNYLLFWQEVPKYFDAISLSDFLRARGCEQAALSARRSVGNFVLIILYVN